MYDVYKSVLTWTESDLVSISNHAPAGDLDNTVGKLKLLQFQRKAPSNVCENDVLYYRFFI